MNSVQREFTDGYFHKHYTAAELGRALTEEGLKIEKCSITHMNKKMTPLVPVTLDRWIKKKFGWLLVAEFTRL